MLGLPAAFVGERGVDVDVADRRVDVDGLRDVQSLPEQAGWPGREHPDPGLVGPLAAFAVDGGERRFGTARLAYEGDDVAGALEEASVVGGHRRELSFGIVLGTLQIGQRPRWIGGEVGRFGQGPGQPGLVSVRRVDGRHRDPGLARHVSYRRGRPALGDEQPTGGAGDLAPGLCRLGGAAQRVVPAPACLGTHGLPL